MKKRLLMRTAVIVAVLTMAFGTVVAYANVPANVVAQNGNQLSAIETERVENSFIHRADQLVACATFWAGLRRAPTDRHLYLGCAPLRRPGRRASRTQTVSHRRGQPV